MAHFVHELDGRVVGVLVRDKEGGLDVAAVGVLPHAIEDLKWSKEKVSKVVSFQERNGRTYSHNRIIYLPFQGLNMPVHTSPPSYTWVTLVVSPSAKQALSHVPYLVVEVDVVVVDGVVEGDGDHLGDGGAGSVAGANVTEAAGHLDAEVGEIITNVY